MKTRNLLTRLLLMTIGLLAGCFGNNEDAKLRGQFVKGCLTSGLDDDTCQCAFDKLEKHYGMDKLRQLEKRPYDLPADFNAFNLNAMLVCAGKEPIPIPTDTPPQPPAPSPEASQLQEAEHPLGDQDVSTLNTPHGQSSYDISPYALPNRQEEAVSTEEAGPAP